MQVDDDQGHEPAADSGAPADDAYKSAVDLSDLEQPDKEGKAGDDGKAKSKDNDDDAGASDEDETDDVDGEEGKDGDDDAGDEDGDEDEDEQPRKKSRAQRYRERAERLELENAQLRGRISGSLTETEVSAKVAAKIGEPPKEADYPNDYLAWERAATAYELDKRQVTREVKAEAGRAAEVVEARNAERVDRHKERSLDFRNRDGGKFAADFDDVMSKAKDVKVSPVVEDLVLDSRKSAHLVYFFAKNPDRVAAINRMSERDAAREIGRIEARLTLPKPKTQTSAPKPSGRPGAGAAPKSQDAELDAYINKKYGPRK
jgi:hypothetical protein